MYHHIKRIAAATILLGLNPMLVRPAQGDFILWDDEEMTVNTSHDEGILYDESKARIVSGGAVSALDAYHFSTVDIFGGLVWRLSTEHSASLNMSGGKMGGGLFARDSSTVNISGGEAGKLRAYNSATVDISGGEFGTLIAFESSTVNMSGGEAGELWSTNSATVDISGGQLSRYLRAGGSSTVTFKARDFRFGSGLSLDGDRVLGTGELSGEWFDGTRWKVGITRNQGTIRAIPEPSALMLMVVALAGGLLLKKRFSSVKPT